MLIPEGPGGPCGVCGGAAGGVVGGAVGSTGPGAGVCPDICLYSVSNSTKRLKF